MLGLGWPTAVRKYYSNSRADGGRAHRFDQDGVDDGEDGDGGRGVRCSVDFIIQQAV